MKKGTQNKLLVAVLVLSIVAIAVAVAMRYRSTGAVLTGFNYEGCDGNYQWAGATDQNNALYFVPQKTLAKGQNPSRFVVVPTQGPAKGNLVCFPGTTTAAVASANVASGGYSFGSKAPGSGAVMTVAAPGYLASRLKDAKLLDPTGTIPGAVPSPPPK